QSTTPDNALGQDDDWTKGRPALAGSLGHAVWPMDDTVEQILVRDIILAAGHPPADRNAGCLHGSRIAGDERVPPLEVLAFTYQPIGTGRRQPRDPADLRWRQPHAVGHLLLP